MSRFSELASLFASLASNLEAPDPTVTNEIDLSIGNLTRSLNLNEYPRTHILDTALSLMGFTAPQVCDSVIEYTLSTIITVLSSSVECKVLKINEDKFLRVGTSVWSPELTNIMEWSVEIFKKLEGCKGDLCASLLYSVVRLAALAPDFHSAASSMSNHEIKFIDRRVASFASIFRHLPVDIKLNIRNGEIPLRLLLWHLDPMSLKQDVSNILQEVTERPFLSLSTEFYENMEWRSKIVCIVISPSVFLETSSLLHNWFLLTGMSSIIELQIGLVMQVLDIVSRPMHWGMSMEIGSKLPFSHAFFPYDHQSFKILSGPISYQHLQRLLHKLSGSTSARDVTLIDHKSLWSMSINFPEWFSFASILLFYDIRHADKFSVPPNLLHDVKIPCFLGPARYIAWILNPMDKSYQDFLVDYLGKVSELWILKYFNLNKVPMGNIKGKSRVKLQDRNEITSHKLDSTTVMLWLKEYKDMYYRSLGIKGSKIQQSLLLQKIPLGILIGYINHLNANDCALFLHYAATGTIEISSGKRISLTEEYSRADAIAGCKIVFDLADIVLRISSSVFESEENGLHFICDMKLKTGQYLLKCMKRLIQLQCDLQTRRDLFLRVISWRELGRDLFQNDKDFDRVCDSLNVQ